MIKILANDGIDKIALEELKDFDIEIDTNRLEKDELMKKGGLYDIIIVRSNTKMDREVLKALRNTNLKMIIRAGVGLDNIDLETAKKYAIRVENTPNSSANAVAELVIGQILALARFINITNVNMRQNKWEKKQYTGIEISGKTLGIIGYGRIGKAIGKKAQALGMNVIFNDLFVREGEIGQYKELDELLAEADFITVNTPKCDKPVIQAEEIKKMKDGVFLFNDARGGMIDEEAILNGLNSGKIQGAGLDVFLDEPNPNKELLNHPRICLTPHIGGATKEAQRRIALEIVDLVKDFMKERDNIESKTV